MLQDSSAAWHTPCHRDQHGPSSCPTATDIPCMVVCAADSHPHLHKMKAGRPEERLPCGSTAAAPSGHDPMSRPTQQATGTRARVQTTAGSCPAARSAYQRASCQPALALVHAHITNPWGAVHAHTTALQGASSPCASPQKHQHTLNTAANHLPTLPVQILVATQAPPQQLQSRQAQGHARGATYTWGQAI